LDIYWLTANFIRGKYFNQFCSLVGIHYEGISWLYRRFGARIGKRIYWPGGGIDFVEFDLLEIGDDVVFGSRSTIMCSTTTERMKVVIKRGASILKSSSLYVLN
jgi:hypothetical protein